MRRGQLVRLWKTVILVIAIGYFVLLVFIVLTKEAEAFHCGLYSGIIKVLKEKYGEVLQSDTDNIEEWTNINTGTYTVIERIGEMGCIIKVGKVKTGKAGNES